MRLRLLVWLGGVALWATGIIIIAQAMWSGHASLEIIIRATMEQVFGFVVMALSRWIR